jgi:long-chain acyl-CoA synthetase
LICYFGILKAGGIVVNYSPLYSVRELKFQVEDSDTEFMVTLDLEVLLPKITQVMEQTGIKKLIVGNMSEFLPFPKNYLFKLLKSKHIAKVDFKDHRFTSFSKLIDNHGTYIQQKIDPDKDLAVLQYTGGTTGLPKGAMLTHSNIFINVLQIETYATNLKFGEEIMTGVLPLFHVFAMTVVMNVVFRIGGCIVMLPRFDLDAVVKLIAKHKPSLFAGVPTMYTALLNHKKLKVEDFANVKFCMSGGAPISVDLKTNFMKKYDVYIAEGYGLTETSPVVSSNPIGIPNNFGKDGSIGLPLPGTEIFIMNPDDMTKEMPRGSSGEICVKGPQVMAGYLNNPEATEESLGLGMLVTGDIGYMDEDGYSFIIDRSKDLILVGGFNVFPRVVEEAINEHSAVKEVTVIGITDDYRGESPKAFITLNEGFEDISGNEIMEFLKDRLGKHELPTAIEFRDELPKTMIGKLSKKELVAEEKIAYELRKRMEI